MVNEDEETLKKRKERFGLIQAEGSDDKATIEERKKKFGNTEGGGISLDE